MPAPDRSSDSKRQPLNIVRGGSVCQKGDPGAHIVAGSNHPAVCMPTVGADPRPRWKDASNLNAHPISRHSVAWSQHRGTKRTKGGLGQ
jgi:hypothetical protein